MVETRNIVGVGWRFPLGVDGRGGVALAGRQEEIEQAIEIVLNTPRGSRLMRPQFGCRIHELLFAPINAATMATARHYVEEALGWWEPRIVVDDILVERDPDSDACMLITVSYTVKASNDERALVYPFYTIPEEL